MLWIAGTFSLLVAAAGWFYLFYSRGVTNLAGVEQTARNRRRGRLRRAGGVAMILLAICFYIGCDALVRRDVIIFSSMMFAVLLLMAMILILAIVDLRLTRLIQRDRNNFNP